MNIQASSDLLRQQRLVSALCARGSGDVSIEETHISWVLLTGNNAYKIKKSLDLGFLDFSTLQARRFFCAEELRLNRRTAPDLYLDVIPIGGSPEQPELGHEPAIEYAVHMRRFARSGMMDRLLEQGCITARHIDQLAGAIASFHATLPPALPDSPFCQTTAIEAPSLQNFALLQPCLPEDQAMLEAVQKASSLEFAACEKLFRQRAAAGLVRECHGDLHLGNIVLLEDTPVPFDGIEFNAGLRWIDVISDIGFTVMDLLGRNQPQLAWRLLNAYLEHTGDYGGVGVLRFYLAYRAMVRAKVCAIRAGQEDDPKAEHELAICRNYLKLAHDCLANRRPMLIITHGLPGAGKSTFAQIALERLGAVRIRSDVERKRLFNLSARADSHAKTGLDIYSEDATCRTYARLSELARLMVGAGFPVIVDAAFLRHAEREHFRALAKDMGIPFVIAHLQADEAVLVARLNQRLSAGTDASEADVAVLHILKTVAEPLLQQEQAVTFNASGLNEGAWKLFDQRLMGMKTLNP